jgi:hypothetical protein
VRRVAKNFALIILVLMITGGQWALLQTAAWTGMLVGHLHSQTFAVAVSQTFDGQHPCPMCKAIQKGKSSEKKSDVELKPDALNLLRAEAIRILPDDRFLRTICCTNEFSPSLAATPLLRPPRTARV